MIEGKRGRGRPVGDGIDDSRELAEIAEMIASAPKLPATTAYKRIVSKPSLAQIRRIQAKWKAHKSRLLAEACQRHASVRAAEAQPSGSCVLAKARAASADVARRIDELVGGSTGARQRSELFTGRAFQEAMASATLCAASGFSSTVFDREARLLEESTGARFFQDALGMRHSPSMRRALGLDEDRVSRAARGASDDVMSRAMRAYEKSIEQLMG